MLNLKINMEPLKIEALENIDISDQFCQNELIEYFNNLIIKHGRILKKEGCVIIYQEDFITFPGKDIIESVVNSFYESGFAISFCTRDTNEIILCISTNKDDLYDEFYEMDFKTMTGTFCKILNIHKTCDDWHKKREWIERVALNRFNHNGKQYKVINLSKTKFDIIKIEDKKTKKKSIFNFFN